MATLEAILHVAEPKREGAWVLESVLRKTTCQQGASVSKPVWMETKASILLNPRRCFFLISSWQKHFLNDSLLIKIKGELRQLMRRVDSLEKTDAGRDWGQEEKGTTEDEMSGWHHWLDGRESEWTPGVGDGQGSLARCNSWGRKESDTTEQLNWLTRASKMALVVKSLLANAGDIRDTGSVPG